MIPVSPDGLWHYLVTFQTKTEPTSFRDPSALAPRRVTDATVVATGGPIRDDDGVMALETAVTPVDCSTPVRITGLTLLSQPEGGQLARVRDGLLAAKRLPPGAGPDGVYAALDQLIALVDEVTR